jgi:hypothetical protein
MPPKWKRREDNYTFLAQSCRLLHEYISRLTPRQRLYHYRKCQWRLTHYKKFIRLDQGTPEWLACKAECCTGSIGSAMVGHGTDPPLHVKDKMLYPKNHEPSDFSKRMMKHGHDTEDTARKSYQKELEVALQVCFEAYEGNFPVNEAGIPYMRFCNLSLPIHNGRVPQVHIQIKGFFLDLKMPWRGVSLDGIVFIDGVPLWILEIKAPAANDCALYVLFKTDYYDQLMNNLHTIRQHYPTVQFCHIYVFAEREDEKNQAFMDAFYFDEHYFWTWYAEICKKQI